MLDVDIQMDAREDLERRKLNAHLFQDLESRLATMKQEQEEMRSRVLGLKVQTAILGNRFIRLDSPLVMAKIERLEAKLADAIKQGAADLLRT